MLPSFGTADPDIGWLMDNPAVAGIFVAAFLILIGISWKAVMKAADDFIKSHLPLAALCVAVAIPFYSNFLWLPPFLCLAAAMVLLSVPPLRRLRTVWAIAIALIVYTGGYPLQSIADRLVGTAGSGVILIPESQSTMLHSTEAELKDALNLYADLRLGLSSSFQSIHELYIIPDRDPDEKTLRSTYANVAHDPLQMERLSRRLAFHGQLLDIIIRIDFVDAEACGTRRWFVRMQPWLWHKNPWRPWEIGQVQRAPDWLPVSHEEVQATNDERHVIGLLAAYELARYFRDRKVILLKQEDAQRIWANLVDNFRSFAWEIRHQHPLPSELDQAIDRASHDDPSTLATTLERVVDFFRSAPAANDADCREQARRAPSTVLSALGRQ